MFKKTKLVHESLENRQLLAVGCDEISRGQVAVDISGSDCIFLDTTGAASAVAVADAKTLTIDVTAATVSLKAKRLATPTNTLCDAADAKGYTLPGCYEDTKAIFSAVLKVDGQETGNAATKKTCTATITKEITLPKSTLVNRGVTPVASTTPNVQFGNVIADISQALDATVFTEVPSVSAGAAVTGSTAAKLTTAGFLNLVFDVCSDSTGLSFVEGTSAATGAALADIKVQQAGAAVAWTIGAATGSAAFTAGAGPTVAIDAIGFTASAGTATAEPTIGKAIANYKNVNWDMLSAAQRQAIITQSALWKYGNTTNVAPMFG